jgi:hypothetical protein
MIRTRRNILCSPDFRCGDIEAKRAGPCLNLAHLLHGAGIADIGQDRQPVETWDHLAQEFESLASKVGLLKRHSGDVAARPRQTRDEAGANRVPRHCKDDRDDRCRLLCRNNRYGGVRHKSVHLKPDKLSRDLSGALGASLGPAILDRDSATIDPAKFAQSPHKGDNPLTLGRRRVRAQISDHRRGRLLRARRERPGGRRAAERR